MTIDEMITGGNDIEKEVAVEKGAGVAIEIVQERTM